MYFSSALSILNNVIPETKGKKYDGILVKELKASNTLDAGRTTNQTHIAITGKQMDIFPYLMAPGYFDCDYSDRDEELKKYFITQIPLKIYKTNIDRISDKSDMTIKFNGQDSIFLSTSIFRSRRNKQADQVQLSLLEYDDKQFIAFRKMLHTGDYFVLLKQEGTFEYDCFGVKKSDAYPIKDMNNQFYKKPSTTKINVRSLINTLENKNTDRIAGGENILLYGVPGAGKSYTIKSDYCDDAKRMERVVFHPDYMYSDFVGQILPQVRDGQLQYVFTPGPFTKLMKKAWENPIEKYYLVIEEINRGNAPAIFGEIFQLLDRKDSSDSKYRADEFGESEYGITNYDIASVVYGDADHEVRIPSNMWIIATMNTSDQNVFTLDTAFQRRWTLRQIKNDISKAKHASVKIEDTDITWGAFAGVINEIVLEANADMISTEDKRLGAYFAKSEELGKEKFPEKVLKYLWDDAFKMNKEVVFDGDYHSLEHVIEVYNTSDGDKLKSVLRSEVYNKMLNAALKNNNN